MYLAPFVNTALAARLPFRRSIEALRSEGVGVLIGVGGFTPHPPGSGVAAMETYPWAAALDWVEANI